MGVGNSEIAPRVPANNPPGVEYGLNFAATGSSCRPHFMKFHLPLLTAALISTTMAAEAPKIFAGLLQKNVPMRGQIGIILPPPEFDKYVAKVGAAARLDPKWFQEFSAKAKPGEPLPYDPKLGLTKEEHAEYLNVWAKREFKPKEDISLVLRESLGGTWIIQCTGSAYCISPLRYDVENDVFTSPNGELKRISDIKAKPDSILGAWTGYEWKFEEETTLGKSKENLALGRFEGNKYGLVVYRFQEADVQGRLVVDKSIVVRFALGEAGRLPEPPTPGQPAAPASLPTPKPTTKPTSKSSSKR
jgi:hypothetical protein